MSRPPLPVGTWGSITIRRTSSGRWEARTRYRDSDGVTRLVGRTGSSKGAARNALTAALANRQTPGGDTITADSTLTALHDAWLPTTESKAAGTRRLYAESWKNAVGPAMGNLRIREITTQRVQGLIDTLATQRGYSVGIRARTILSGMMGLAVRYGAADHNPVRDTIKPRERKKPVVALTVEEIGRVRAALRAYETRGNSKADVADVVEIQLATGARIGEVLALRWEDVDLAAGTVRITGTVALGVEDRRPFRQDHPKTSSSVRTIPLPRFGLTILLERHARAHAGDVLVFPSARGTVRDTNALRKSLSRALEGTGLEYATATHVFRKTVATVVDDAEDAASLLGHRDSDVTRERYRVAPPTTVNVSDQLDAAFGDGTHTA